MRVGYSNCRLLDFRNVSLPCELGVGCACRSFVVVTARFLCHKNAPLSI